MTYSICTAIANLPAHLLTTAIIDAGVNEGSIELLDYLPKEYLTTDNIQKIIQKDENSWRGFSLKKLPMDKRSQEVCNVAVQKDLDNLPDVPYPMRNTAMLMVLMGNLKKHLHYLTLIPSACWNSEAVYKGIRNLCSSSPSYNYGHRSRYSSYGSNDYEKKNAMEKVQVLLSYVPRPVKSRKFYFGLLDEVSSEMAVALIPACHKQGNYFELLAKHQPDLVPADKYTHEMFMNAIGPDTQKNIYDITRENGLHEKLLSVLDDVLADTIIAKTPGYFLKLPKALQTTSRLLKILDDHDKICNLYSFVRDIDASLLTIAVCKKFICKKIYLPTFPTEIWNDTFVKHCLKHDETYAWFQQMPQQYQTLKIVSAAITYSLSNAECALPQYITYEVACKLNMEANTDDYHKQYREYVPTHYYKDFEAMTGLPKEFMGGECTFQSFRENKKPYTYCQLGGNCIGIYSKGVNSNAYFCLILTRRTPMAIRPEVVFDKAIGTFHKTWLEKMVADYDRSFTKPVVESGLKKLQTNGYYNVKLLETTPSGIKIFRNFFMDAPISYVAEKNGIVSERNTKESLMKLLQ